MRAVQMNWHTKDSSEGEEGDAPTMFRDIYQGDERIAKRVDLEAADGIVKAHNQNPDKWRTDVDERLRRIENRLKNVPHY